MFHLFLFNFIPAKFVVLVLANMNTFVKDKLRIFQQKG